MRVIDLNGTIHGLPEIGEKTYCGKSAYFVIKADLAERVNCPACKKTIKVSRVAKPYMCAK